MSTGECNWANYTQGRTSSIKTLEQCGNVAEWRGVYRNNGMRIVRTLCGKHKSMYVEQTHWEWVKL